jgi:hypothetical protein
VIFLSLNKFHGRELENKFLRDTNLYATIHNHVKANEACPASPDSENVPLLITNT